MERKQKREIGMAPTVEVDMRDVADDVHYGAVIPDDEKPTVKPPAYSSSDIPAHSYEPLITPDGKGGWMLGVKYIAEVEYSKFGHKNTWIVPCTPGLKVSVSHFVDSSFLRSDLVKDQLAADRSVVWIRMNGATEPVDVGRLDNRLVRDINECFYMADLTRSRQRTGG